jgi:hypothetical protein
VHIAAPGKQATVPVCGRWRHDRHARKSWRQLLQCSEMPGVGSKSEVAEHNVKARDLPEADGALL